MLIRTFLFGAIAALSVRAVHAEAPFRAIPEASFRASEVPAFARPDAAPLMLRAPVAPDPAIFAGRDVGENLAGFETGALARAPSPGSTKRDLQLQAVKPVSSGDKKADSAAPADDDEEEDDTNPVRPGTFTQSSTKIPSRFLRTNTVAPHTGSPDISYNVNNKTTIGLFGDMTRTSRTDTRSNLAKPERDVGAGVTIQYKFGH